MCQNKARVRSTRPPPSQAGSSRGQKPDELLPAIPKLLPIWSFLACVPLSLQRPQKMRWWAKTWRGRPSLQRPRVRRRQGPYSGSLCWGPLAHDPLQGPQGAMCDMNCEEARTQPRPPLVHVFQAWGPSTDPSSRGNFLLWSRPSWAHPVREVCLVSAVRELRPAPPYTATSSPKASSFPSPTLLLLHLPQDPSVSSFSSSSRASLPSLPAWLLLGELLPP